MSEGGDTPGPSSKRRRDATGTPLVTDDGHAASLLARIDELRDKRELTDLVLYPGRSDRSGGGGGSGLGDSSSESVQPVHAHALIMAAASPYIHTQIMRWGGDNAGAGGGGEEGDGSLTTSTASATSSSSSSASESKRDSCTGTTTQLQLQGREITIPEIDGATLAAAVEFAYTGTMILDTARKEEALPILGAFQLLDMAVRTYLPYLLPTPPATVPVPNPACCFHVMNPTRRSIIPTSVYLPHTMLCPTYARTGHGPSRTFAPSRRSPPPVLLLLRSPHHRAGKPWRRGGWRPKLTPPAPSACATWQSSTISPRSKGRPQSTWT